MPGRAVVAAVLAAAVLGPVTPAGAARVTGTVVAEYQPKGQDLMILDVALVGGTAEASALTVTASGASVTVTDAASPLQAMGACAQRTATQVTCTGATAQRLSARLGEGN